MSIFKLMSYLKNILKNKKINHLTWINPDLQIGIKK